MPDLKPVSAAEVADLKDRARTVDEAEDRLAAACAVGADENIVCVGHTFLEAAKANLADTHLILRLCDTVEAMRGMLAELHADVTDALCDDHNSGAADGVLLGFPRERITRLAALLKEDK